MLEMRNSTLLSFVLVCGALTFASVAYAMPSEGDVKKARPVVDSLIADDLYALNNKTKTPAAVASTMRSLAEKADTEAGKFLLLQSIFSVYASTGMYDEAGDALENLSAEISDVPPEEIVKMVDGVMSRADPEKAPKVLSIYRVAQRKVKCRRRLESAKAEFKKRPNDKALIRTIGDCYVGMGDWPRALKAYSRLGIAAAKYEMSPYTTPNCDAMAAADFWWDYKAADDEPFKVHAAELYSVAVEKGLATGLRREMALKRIGDSKNLGVLRAQSRQITEKANPHAGDTTVVQRSSRNGLIHRWSFDRNLKDSVGNCDGRAVDGALTFKNGQVRIRPGGGYVDLGANVIPGGGAAEYTLEVWATKHSIQDWARVFQIPDNWEENDFYWTWNSGVNPMQWQWSVAGWGHCPIRMGNGTGENVENHFVVVYGHESDKTPYYHVCLLRGRNVYWHQSMRLKGSMFTTHSAFWLGHSYSSRDATADASYNEVRIWNRAFTHDEIMRSAELGPDRLP